MVFRARPSWSPRRREGKYMPARLARFCPGVTLCAMAAYTVRVYFCACMRVASVNLQPGDAHRSGGGGCPCTWRERPLA